jgi:signal transduction histidine kinase
MADETPHVSSASSTRRSLAAEWSGRADDWAGRTLFPGLLSDPELSRRARLITRFGFLGFIFGTTYAAFYLAIGHHWGAGIIVICSLLYGLAPFLIRWTQSLALPGHLLSGIMAAGFTALCTVEGGMHGHAIAWLASVPLCALLLVDWNGARLWAGMSILCGTFVVAADFLGIKFPNTFDPSWLPVVTAAGYLGLIAFMFLLGVIFETSRERAFTRLRNTLNELENSNSQLVHLNNEKNEFLGIAAHDLKNPLTAIIGSAELITLAPNSSKVGKLATNISSAGKRMRDLITNLLDANAIEQGKFTSNLERCDLSVLVAQSVEQNLPNATRKEISIQAFTPSGMWVMADKNATMQILDNLISNAVKYSPPKSTVLIATVESEGRISAEVKDHGPGLSEDDQKKLFRKFTRLSSKPTAGESSTGLGLSIVKRLAESMSGTVDCQSKLGEGSTFAVRLPAATEPTSALEKAA